MLQAESAIFVDNANSEYIHDGLRNRCGYSKETWLFRIPRSSAAAKSARYIASLKQ